MDKFQFVTVSHPDQIKDKKQQSTIRRHAIRSSLKKNRDDAAERRENFIALEVSSKVHGLVKKRMGVGLGKISLVVTPSNGRQDPFNTMPGSTDRLRVLMGHSMCTLFSLDTSDFDLRISKTGRRARILCR
jgi:hypothetical protein